MSALDQQVAAALSAYDKAQRDAGREIADSGKLYYDQEIAIATTRDALLTTHRRQVLTDIEAKLRGIPAGDFAAGYWKQKHADFVASLRDTKEDV